MARLQHADLVKQTAAEVHPSRHPATARMTKSASRCRSLPGHRTRSPKDGLSRGDHRPPDGARLSLAGVRGQAPDPVLALSSPIATSRALPSAPAAVEAEAEAAALGKCSSPGSPTHPGKSASPAAEAAAEAEAAAAE